FPFEVQCANLTVIFCPAARRLPAGGDCSRATPLPTTSMSSPDCWAISIAARIGFPRKDGTITPLSTARTTVPLSGRIAAAADNVGVSAGALLASFEPAAWFGSGTTLWESATGLTGG